MKIRAQVHNQNGQHQAVVSTEDHQQSINISPKAGGFGSGVNGGELLFLALATCYCNDIYREAARLGIEVQGVEVTVQGEFGGVGEPAKQVAYQAKVTASNATEAEVKALIEHTDKVAEIQNTLRTETPVQLDSMEINLLP